MSDHWGFVAAAYAVTIVTIGGAARRIIVDYRRLRRELARFAASGRDTGENA